MVRLQGLSMNILINYNELYCMEEINDLNPFGYNKPIHCENFEILLSN